MTQGLIQTLLVRLPFAYIMSIQPNASLTMIGLAAPVSTIGGNYSECGILSVSEPEKGIKRHRDVSYLLSRCFSLHGNPSKCICHGTNQYDRCKDRAEILDHKVEIFSSGGRAVRPA